MNVYLKAYCEDRSYISSINSENLNNFISYINCKGLNTPSPMTTQGDIVTKTIKKAQEDILLPIEQTLPIIQPKMLKFTLDACFGNKYEQEQQCTDCWIKHSCHVVFRNQK